jgi:hypothetical protein
LLNIDPKSWSLKWDFSNFITQMGEFSKMLSMIGDLLNAIKDGAGRMPQVSVRQFSSKAAISRCAARRYDSANGAR